MVVVGLWSRSLRAETFCLGGERERERDRRLLSYCRERPRYGETKQMMDDTSI